MGDQPGRSEFWRGWWMAFYLMRNFFKSRSEFGRNVLALMSGTIIAKAISIGVIPILTRIYAPSDFGLFALYSSAVAILAVFSTGRYELAVVQARNSRDADRLVVCAIGLAAIFGLLLLGVIALSSARLVAWVGQPGIAPWLYLLPLSVFLTAAYQSLSYWLNRNKHYRRMGGNRVLQAGITAGANVGFGAMRFGAAGLILGQVLGLSITTFLLALRFFPLMPRTKQTHAIALLRRYQAYLKYDLPASSMNVMAQQAPNLLLTPLFGALSAGHYFLIQRLFMLPVTLLSSSIGSVFRQSATEQYRKTGSFRPIFWSVFRRLSAIVILPTLIFMFVAEDLFGFVFGPAWAVAGEYARILAPMFMLKFIVSPLTYTLYIRDKLYINTLGQFMYLVFMLMAVFTGYWSGDFMLTIQLISALSSVIYIFYFVVSIRLAS